MEKMKLIKVLLRLFQKRVVCKVVKPLDLFMIHIYSEQKAPGERREPTFDVSAFTKRALNPVYVPPQEKN